MALCVLPAELPAAALFAAAFSAMCNFFRCFGGKGPRCARFGDVAELPGLLDFAAGVTGARGDVADSSSEYQALPLPLSPDMATTIPHLLATSAEQVYIEPKFDPLCLRYVKLMDYKYCTG